MTPLEFERRHEAAWRELEIACGLLREPSKPERASASVDRARFATLYRATCEDLELARARAYPVALVRRLEAITAACHQRIYRQVDLGLGRAGRFFLVTFPEAVRAEWRLVLVAAAVFIAPMFAVGLASYFDPGFVLTIQTVERTQEFDRMYGGDMARGRPGQEGDWLMFGHYIRNNVGISFQCFASGVFLGVGSLFYLGLNGVLIGGVAGYLTWRGLGENFYAFVITHSAFELTAIVLSGAAGLMLGLSLLAPGRLSRRAALVAAARRAVPIVYGVTALLVIAAAIEAFWSGAPWVSHAVKFGVGGACWALVLGYFGWQGRAR